MSTALTPIITQIELDRDRFKDLINGDITDTVQLETRVEYSIAGQVRNRIDQLVADLDAAINQAEAARDAAQLAQTGAETAEDGAQLAETGAVAAKDAAQLAQTGAETAETTTLGYRDETLGYRNETQTWRNETEVFRNDAEGFYTSTQDIINDFEAEAASGPISLSVVSPIIDSTLQIEAPFLEAQPFDYIGDVRWVGRTFELIRVDGFATDGGIIDEPGNENYTVMTTQPFHGVVDLVQSVEIDPVDLNLTDTFAWRFRDDYIKTNAVSGPYRDRSTAEAPIKQGSWSGWVVFTCVQNAEYVSKPSITSIEGTDDGNNQYSDVPLTPVIEFSAPVVNNSANTADYTQIRIYTSDGDLVFDRGIDSTLGSYEIPFGYLKGKTDYNGSQYNDVKYIVAVRHIVSSTLSTERSVLSPWSDVAQLTIGSDTLTADESTYDNTDTGINATDAQAALDEIRNDAQIMLWQGM